MKANPEDNQHWGNYKQNRKQSRDFSVKNTNEQSNKVNNRFHIFVYIPFIIVLCQAVFAVIQSRQKAIMFDTIDFMLDNLILNKNSIESIYKTICGFHSKYLRQFGVKLPKLYGKKGDFTKNALVLVYLAYDYPNTREVSKEELTKFVRSYYPNTNDVQQARHLGAQAGWWIVAGGRDNIVLKVGLGSYQLYTLEKPYPSFTSEHRIQNIGNWQKIKAKYHFRCATCGSEESKPHLHWSATKTVLQKSHMDPNKPLIVSNIIPQCQKCNRGDRNRWVYDNKGRVVKLANPNVINSCDKEVQKQVYRILYKIFDGKKPEEL